MMPISSRTLRRLRPVTLTTLTIFAIGITVFAVRATMAELESPSAQDRQVAIAVSSFLNKDHLSRHSLDDEISQRSLDMFLKTLDPMKMYFLQSDIDRFQQSRNDLDDMVKTGKLQFAYEVYEVYLKRLDERMAAVDKWLKTKHDFTVDESLDTDFDARKWPRDAAEASERWRLRIKYDLLIQKAAEVAEEDALEKLAKRYRTFADAKRQADGDELLEIFLTSLTTSYDPHTTYMSASTLENFSISMRLKLEGIGAALQMLDGDTVVSKIIPGGAADKDGRLEPEDHIIGVGQGPEGEIEDVVGMRLNDVVKKIRGQRGTIVRLQVLPKGKGEPKVFNITRAQIELKDSEARAEVIEVGKKANGAAYRVGVIDLPSFYMDMDGARLGKPNFKSTTRDVKRLLEQFNQNGVDAVVLDLRENGGGSLTEAINLTGLFIEKGPIVQVKDADGQTQHYDDLDPGVSWEGPLVVLVSKFSASASEIFAGAIQDYRRGLVVGDRATHGKGTVQTLLNVGRQLYRFPTTKLGALKITMQQFYRPNGDSTQNRGVISDVELPSITTHLDVGESDLDYALDFDRIEPVAFQPENRIGQGMLDLIKKRSSERLKSSEDFQKVLQQIAKYKDQKARKSISLNEEKFMAERAELEKDQEKIQNGLDEEDNDDGKVVKQDFYFDEALAITVDYIQLLSGGRIAAAN